MRPQVESGLETDSESHPSQVYPPFTPEMSPLAMATSDDSTTTRSGRGISKRLRSADTQHTEQAGAEKRRRPLQGGTKPVSLKKMAPLDHPLSEVMKRAGHGEVFDVFTHVHRPSDKRKEEALREGKVKRPLNGFLLYQKHVIGFVKKRLLAEENKNNQQLVSRICGDSWKIETDEIKTKFKKLAHVEKTRHGQAFPRYKYTPKPGKKPDADDNDKHGMGGNGVRSAIASGTGGGMATSSPHLIGASGQYNFSPHAEAAETDAIARQHSYGEDAFGMKPLATHYGHHYPSIHGMADIGQIWGQEMPPVDGCVPESHPRVDMPTTAHLHGIDGSSSDLYIDPSLLPGMREAAYHWLPQEGLHSNPVWQPYGETAGDVLAMMPDLDINGAHNAYLRGGQEDWHVEPLDDAGHFSDWMAHDENTGT